MTSSNLWGNLKNTGVEGVNPRWTSIPSRSGAEEILLIASDTTDTGITGGEFDVRIPSAEEQQAESVFLVSRSFIRILLKEA